MKELKDMSLEELWQLFPIILKPHNPDYTLWYEDEKAAIITCLNGVDIKRVSHIGSTSVLNLIAKPIVDILLELPVDYDLGGTVNMLEASGWIVMDRNDTDKTIDLNKGYTPAGFAEKVFHLHVKQLGDWGELYFKDYLRKYPEVARRYEELKLGLKERFEHDRDAYTNAKSDFILGYTQKARAEFCGRYIT